MTDSNDAIGFIVRSITEVQAIALLTPQPDDHPRMITTNEKITRAARLEIQRLIDAGVIVIGELPELWTTPSPAELWAEIGTNPHA